MTLLNYEPKYFKEVVVDNKKVIKSVVYVDILGIEDQTPQPSDIPNIEGFPGNYTVDNTLFAQGSIFFNVSSGDKFIYGEDTVWYLIK